MPSNCSTCANCDLVPCRGPEHRPSSHGWCVPRSLYGSRSSYELPPGGVRGPDAVAKPTVVDVVEGVPNCALYRPGRPRGAVKE